MSSPSTHARPVLAVRDLTTVFRGRDRGLVAVDHVSFDVHEGEIVALVGESGSGKSVTALSIIGLLDRQVAAIAAGSVLLDGQDLRALDPQALRRLRGDRIAMVFQEPMTSLNPTLTVGRQLTEALEIHRGMDARSARTAATEALRSVGIPDPDRRLAAYPHEMSGGMRQRVMVAIALSCQPRLLLADEPTTALDVTTQAQILDLVKALAAQSRTAVLLITHDLGLVARYAHRVNVMYGGRLVEQGPTQAVFNRPRHPYTRALLASIPRIDAPRRDRLQAIDGMPPTLAERDAGCAFRARCIEASAACAQPQAWQGAEGTHRAACWRAGASTGVAA